MSSVKSKRLELSDNWGSSSELYVTVNGYRAQAVYYQNGKGSWTSEEAASAIANLINGSSGAHAVSQLIDPNLTGARASISVDDPSTVIIRSTIVDGPLEVSYLTGTSNGSPGSVSLKEDNNVDDSVASNPTISASIADLSNTSEVVINTSSLQGDTENIYSITDYSWYSVDAENNRTLLQSGTKDNLELTVTSAQNILLSTTYLDGELNQKTVESNTLLINQVNIDSSLKSKRLELSDNWGSSSELYVTVNGYRAQAVYYQNGKGSWTSEEAASAIANLINGSSGAHAVSQLIDPNLTGARASISVDDPSTVIIRSTIVDGPLEVSYLTGTSNGSPGSVSLKEDNNVDDSNLSLTISQLINAPASSERELSLSLTSDNENIHSYIQTEWFKNGSSYFVSSGLSSLTVDSSIDGTYYAVLEYFDGELNNFSVSSDSVLFDSTAPIITSSAPADNATAVATTSDIVLNFSEEVYTGSGNIVIYKASSDSGIETIDVTSDQVTGTGTNQITINPSSDLEEQTQYYVQLAATAFDDSVGNSFEGISDKTSLSFTTADETAPSAPISLTTSSTTTNDNTPTITGIAEANSTIKLHNGSILLGSGTADSNGAFSITSSILSDGSYSLTATATDSAGNTSTSSSALAIIVDSTAPSPPTSLTTSSTTTNDNTPTITGNAEAGSTVKLYSGTTLLGSATADSNGAFSITSSILSNGSYSLTATATDSASNTSSTSSALSITINAPIISNTDFDTLDGWSISKSSDSVTIQHTKVIADPYISDGSIYPVVSEIKGYGSNEIPSINGSALQVYGYNSVDGVNEYIDITQDFIVTNAGSYSFKIDAFAHGITYTNQDKYITDFSGNWKQSYGISNALLVNDDSIDGLGMSTNSAQTYGQTLEGSINLEIGTHTITLRTQTPWHYGKGFFTYWDNLGVDSGDAIFSISGTKEIAQTLSISQDSPDPDGSGTLSYSWQTSSDNSTWSVVGTSATYTVGANEEGKSIKAVISYEDEQGFNESIATSSSNIPFVDDGDASFSISGTTAVGETLSISQDSTDPDGSGTLSYSWQTSSDNSSWSAVGTSATYTIGASEQGKSIRAVLSYTDAQGFEESVTTSTFSIPAVDDGDASFSIVGTKSVGNYLSIKRDSQDPDGTGTLSYQWQSSSDGSTWSNVSTNSTYRLQYTDSDKYYRASISYTDDDGFSETITTDTIQIDKHSIHNSLDSLNSQLSNLSYSTSFDYTSLGLIEQFGSSSGETLYASGSEIVWGLGGDDALKNSYSYYDQYLIGGSGNDTYTIDGTAVAIIYEAPNQGTNDTLYLSSNYLYYGYAASINNKHLVAIDNDQAVVVLDAWENTGIEKIYLGNAGYTSSYFLSILPSLPGYLGNVSWDDIKPFTGDLTVETAKRLIDEIKSDTITVESDFEYLRSSLKIQIDALEAQAADLNSDVEAPYAPISLTTAALAYIASHQDLISAIGTDTALAIKHYNDFSSTEGRTITFNAAQYLENYPDLTNAFGSDTEAAIKHFINNGFREGRSFRNISSKRLIDTSSSSNNLKKIETSNKTDIDSITYQSLTDIEALDYIVTNDDLGKLYGNDIGAAKSHYENNGKYEGRILDDFDELGYLASKDNLMNIFENNTIEGIKHHISFGITEGRSTNIFDAESYLNKNADLSKTLGTNQDMAKKHYVEYGFNEGRIF